jgi:hypothetical protein
MRVFVPLYLTPGCTGIFLRQMRGLEEINIGRSDTATALELLESMLDKDAEAVKATSIVTADRDRILAAIYQDLYGSKIESTVSCRHCREQFDVDFSLTTLLTQLHPGKTELPKNGLYETANGVVYRLPTGADEMKAILTEETDPAQALLAQCLVDRADLAKADMVEEAMATLAPVMNLEMQAICPECAREQNVRFDMQTFLLVRLKKERPRLLYEIHRIASSYHWSQQEILQLPRTLRKQYVELIEGR